MVCPCDRAPERITRGDNWPRANPLAVRAHAGERLNRRMQTILIFDFADVLIEGFSRFVASLSQQLRWQATDVIAGLGGEPLVALTEGRIAETTYWQSVLERTHWPITVQALDTMKEGRYSSKLRQEIRNLFLRSFMMTAMHTLQTPPSGAVLYLAFELGGT